MAERDELDRQLALARRALVAPAALRARVEARLLPASAGGGGELPAAVALRTGAVAEGWLARARRWLARGIHPVAVAVLVGLGFGAGYWLGRSPGVPDAANGAVATSVSPLRVAAPNAPSSSGVAPSVESPRNAAAEASAAPSASASELTRPAPRVTRTSAVRGKARPVDASRSARRSDEALAAEVALLQRVERALRSGEPALATSLLDELDRAVPEGTLRQERTAARVLAHCGSAAASPPAALEQRAARAAAERFLLDQGASVYGDRIRSACALEVEGVQSAPTKNTRALDTQRSKEDK